MKPYNIFIDGSAGTTGLRIADRLAARPEFRLLHLPEAERKDLKARAAAINGADLAFLCLPDAAAREVVPLLSPAVRVLDTSTAHRTAPGWVYGLPELSGQRAKIAQARRVAVPGCHATGFVVLAAPLVALGLAKPGYPFCCHSLSGYSGGGKKMIAQYEGGPDSAALKAPRPYGLNLSHKHLPEMQAMAGLTAPPVFCPIVDDYYCGMEVTVPLRMELLSASPAQVAEGLAAYYAGQSQITVHPLNAVPADGFLPANALAGTDRLEIYCTASPDGSRMLLISVFDNLGKGASGAAVQCMNLMLGLPETAGLE
jgi:N-acetyl-gamma-glutamyl-phosphate reductase